MISIDFLKVAKQVSGLEFMDFQSLTFFKKLSGELEQHIEDGVLKNSFVKPVSVIIEEYTGFSNIKFKLSEVGNLGVDVGYMSPNNVINNKMCDELLSHTQTTLYRWFKANEGKIFAGSVDYTKGKVNGSFKTIPVKIEINRKLNDTFPFDELVKYKVTMAEVLAGAVVHELGHCFGACMMVNTTMTDDILGRSLLRHYRVARTKEDKVVILKDVATLLDLPQVKKDEIETFINQDGGDSEEAAILYYEKMLKQRNTQRATSLGVAEMTSEVMADMYAIRMGCDKGIMGAIGLLVNRGFIKTVMTNFFFSAMLGFNFGILGLVIGGTAVALPVFVSSFIIFSTLTYFSPGFSGIYNADHRRYDDAMRQLITKLKEATDFPVAERADLVKRIEDYITLNKKLKPWYENSSVRNIMGWILHGSDFKLNEVAHYAKVLAANEINVLKDTLIKA